MNRYIYGQTTLGGYDDLGDIVCVEADYDEGKNRVYRMADAYETMRANPTYGDRVAAKFYTAVQSIINRWNILVSQPIYPFSTLKCQAKDLGVEADSITKQMYTFTGLGTPDIKPPSRSIEDIIKNGITGAGSVFGDIGSAVKWGILLVAGAWALSMWRK